MKGHAHFAQRGASWDTRTMDQAATCHCLGSSKPKDEDEEDRSVIAQPIFVFKKERHCKRPAEDPVCKTENVSINCSRKRARSSSFSFQSSDSQLYTESVLSKKHMRSSSVTILPTFPPSQPVKNNIFMTSELLQQNVAVKDTEKGFPSKNVKDVLRPAILQPPQAARGRLAMKICAKNVLEAKPEVVTEVSEDNCSWRGNSERPLLSLHVSDHKIMHHLPEGRTFSSSNNCDFVFGENILERVLRPEKPPELNSKGELQDNERSPMVTTGFCSTPPWTTPLFAKDTSLIESAAAYISSKPRERYIFDKVEVTTGEEAEYNVLQINCRLFLFNKASLSWTERGSGSLRLNDISSNQCGMLQSRLVMRNQGSMRLILNTKLWTQMIIERANRKSLCITATDLEDSSVKVFLIQATSKDIGSLYAAIHHRLVALKNFAKQECNTNQGEPEPDIQPLNCDSDDEENGKMTPMRNSKSDHSRWVRGQPVICS
ncbi:ran-binding protein 3-like isoform X2 [Varanus komodoensis]|uniref:ran-binding protein 3-like isoform X2 n=1 Tax=Varanus komodoensis TaxID=61221 RepID=UPI001CF78ABB|nr:ran-binding protein 3-like isoform X2 [Varanus komodoensis]